MLNNRMYKHQNQTQLDMETKPISPGYALPIGSILYLHEI